MTVDKLGRVTGRSTGENGSRIYGESQTEQERRSREMSPAVSSSQSLSVGVESGLLGFTALVLAPILPHRLANSLLHDDVGRCGD